MLHIPLSTLNQKIKRLDIQVKRRLEHSSSFRSASERL